MDEDEASFVLMSEDEALSEIFNAQIMELKNMFPDTPVKIIKSIYERNNYLQTETCEELLTLNDKDADVKSESNHLPVPGTSSSRAHEADEILKLKDMFPDTPFSTILSTYERNNCLLKETCEELLTSTDNSVQSYSNDPGPGTSGAQRKHQQDDDVTIISDEDDNVDTEISQKVTVDKLAYLQGIFPDVQILYFKKNLAQMGDDDSKFHIFLNECLADPKRLPRQVKVVPSVQRGSRNGHIQEAQYSS